MQYYFNASDNLNETNAAMGNLTVSDEKQHLINNDNDFLLQQYQQSIAKATHVLTSIRKLSNDLITVKHLELIKKN